jgi:putative oxidoreductase
MTSDLGLLLIRLTVGFLLFGHGTMKLFGWFGGSGLRATIAMMRSHLRLRPPEVWGALAGLTEVGGGILFGLGLLNPLGPLGIVAAMLVAIVLVHPDKLWAQNRGMELPLIYLISALAVGLIGPGAYSLDALLGTGLPEPVSLVIGIILVMTGVAFALASRAPASRATRTIQPEGSSPSRR